MIRFVSVALLFVVSASLAFAEPQERARRADRKAVVALLQREGIVAQKTRVTDVRWAGDFWIVTVRHPAGKTTNWQVDAMARDYSYLCQH
jgi:hypothetical protein